jgi:transcriptional regulator with XRE-family HTH domain
MHSAPKSTNSALTSDFIVFFVDLWLILYTMIGSNLKYLRKKHNLSQQAFAEILDIPRTTLGDYEREKTEPNIPMLLKMAAYFTINVDNLLVENLQLENYKIAESPDLKVLAISVDNNNEGNIELVDTKAEAGYLDSYQNPEYIKELPKFAVPNIPSGTYRAFEIQGDSMLPIQSGSIIIASYIEQLQNIKNNKTYIVISKRDGLVYKRVLLNSDENKLVLKSDNDLFIPYELEFSEVDEIWQYYAHLTFDDSEKTISETVEVKLGDMHSKISDLHKKLI